MAESLRELIVQEAPLPALAAFSDALELEARLGEVRSLRARDLARLYSLADRMDGPPADIAFFVPAATPPQRTVEWVGKNSLPVFTAFTKRFTRSPDPGSLTGHNTGVAQRLVGPGYFTAVVRPEKPTELLLDYTRTPALAPEGWPCLRPNEAGLSRWVFGGLQDYFRPIGRDLGVGAAYTREGMAKGQHFALARGHVLPFGY